METLSRAVLPLRRQAANDKKARAGPASEAYSNPGKFARGIVLALTVSAAFWLCIGAALGWWF